LRSAMPNSCPAFNGRAGGRRCATCSTVSRTCAPLHHSPEIVKAINAQSFGRLTSSHFAVIPVLSSRAKFLSVDLSTKLPRCYPSAYFRIAL
jgi:hypothetical protein